MRKWALEGLLSQADTLIVQAPPVGLERWAAISVIAIAIVLVFVILALVFVLYELRRFTRKVTETVGRIEPNVHPVLERARGVTENVEHITGLVRKDVDRVTESVEAVTGRLNQAAAHMEERIDEFNALVEVVQMEAEGIFLDTASTVHGVRAGAASLGGLPAEHREMPAVPDLERVPAPPRVGTDPAEADSPSEPPEPPAEADD